LAKKLIAREVIEIPPDVEVRLSPSKVFVKGPRGEIERDLSHATVDIRRGDNELIIEAHWPDKRMAALVGTVKSHIENMMTGVLKGFTYKLKIVFAHFPISVKIQDDEVVIENFGGERRSRRAQIQGDVKVTVQGEDVLVKGINIDDVSQTAANIQQATRIKKKDPRIFLDGVYVFEKGEAM
jgi:large subunit ribosomal protein L6